MEVAVFWRGDLFSVDYVSPRADLDVPEGDDVEVRTRLVEPAPRTPRSPMDFPYLAIATIAACLHGLVIGSFAWSSSGASGSGERLLVSVSATDDVVTQSEGAPLEGRASSSANGEGKRETGSKTFLEERDVVSLEEWRTFGMIELLRGYEGQGASAWVDAPKGDGAMWANAIGSFGAGGLSLSGTGEGGGGKALGSVTLDRVHTTSVATSTCRGTLSGAHRASTIHCTLGFAQATVNGRLPPETIQRVVRDSLGRFRNCYMTGLERDPKLSGRVATKFVIARDGSVAAVADAGSDLKDAEVVACIQRTFSALEFPESPSGVVSVVYPLDLSLVE
jgi:hypothetical protein